MAAMFPGDACRRQLRRKGGVVTKAFGEDPHDPTGREDAAAGPLQGWGETEGMDLQEKRGSENCLPVFLASRTLN